MEHLDATRMHEIKWFHTIEIEPGVFTHGARDLPTLLKEADTVFKYSIEGKTFLDIGAWDGFFSFEAEKRGASRVLATDWFCWSGPGWGTQEGFNFARRLKHSKVEDIEIDVPDIKESDIGLFDVVLLSGVLYHVKDIITILETVSKVAKKTLIVETAVDGVDYDKPAAVYIPALDYNVDPTNYWAPNPACVVAILKSCGFSDVEVLVHPCFERTSPRGTRYYFFANRSEELPSTNGAVVNP